MNHLRAFLPRSFLGRALLILLLPMVLAQLVATYIFFDRHWQNLTARLAYGVAGDVALAVAQSDNPNALRLIERHTDFRIHLEPLHTLPPHNSKGMINNALAQALARRLDETHFVVIDRAIEKLREVQVITPQGVLHLEIPERRLSSATASVFLVWMVGSALFFFAIAVLFMRNQIRPIRRLASAAESFGKGQEVIGFKPEGALEVRRAAQAFLVMHERIQRQIRQRTEMLAGVSHDLRTPLTRMRLQLALLPQQEGLDELLTDISEMEQMVEGYLAFARGEGGEPSETLDLIALLHSLTQRFLPNEAISVSLPERVCLMTLRPHAMRRCFGNLVSNALRYGKRVHLTMEEADTAVFVYIDDDGTGIPADKRADVLRPFVRLEESRNPDTGGVGLGLTIASDIAKGHGGDLSLSTSPTLGGLRVTVRLPK